MEFYMITYGLTQVEELYIGKTKEEVVANARPLINQWPEYKAFSDEEIIELNEENELEFEFDLVKIGAPWPGKKADRDFLINLYENNQII